MKHVAFTLPILVLIGCETKIVQVHDRVGCDSASSSTSDGESSSSDDTSTTTTGNDPDGDGIPNPTATCPTFVDGIVQFCPAGLDTCRNARVVNAANADGNGFLSLHWHGTYESPEAVLAWDSSAQAIQERIVAEHGLMVLPYADPRAPARANTPFPWWRVCGTSGTECDRMDDFVFANEIVACAVEQQLVDPNRLTTSGMSAGGSMASHLVNNTSYLAGAVSWSGAVPPNWQPSMPDNETAVLVLHGGATDAYCGAGAPGANGCYYFRPPSEVFAQNLADAGNFTFLCDHQAGHSASMGLQGAYFLAWSNLEDGHVWEGYPFGTGGGVGTGSSWMLNHYCYLPGQPSPWD